MVNTHGNDPHLDGLEQTDAAEKNNITENHGRVFWLGSRLIFQRDSVSKLNDRPKMQMPYTIDTNFASSSYATVQPHICIHTSLVYANGFWGCAIGFAPPSVDGTNALA
ncbi:hypothetical protein SASPL_131062 [Salvia splendens]|uniref:Uncharacterized protein n=1 Tax=Salvia splendens TaxID=180675 RepID=A0A8X8X5A6_SALSN|nr:hypothetical protein SASPL_131062 [Salvia splendens]